jgi:hypothetical protein
VSHFVVRATQFEAEHGLRIFAFEVHSILEMLRENKAKVVSSSLATRESVTHIWYCLSGRHQGGATFSEMTYRTQVLGMLQLCLNAHIINSCIQNTTEVTNDVLFGIQKDWLGRIRVVRNGGRWKVQHFRDTWRRGLLHHDIAILI